MPPKRASEALGTDARPTKKAKISGNAATASTGPTDFPIFTSAKAMSDSLVHTYNPAQLAANLVALRGFALSRASNTDAEVARVRLIAEWLGSGGVQEVESILESSNNQSTILNPLFSLVCAVLHALRSHAEHVGALTSLANLVLSDRQAERLSRAVRQDDASLVLSTMKLWLEVATMDTFQARVATVWNWSGKTGTKLLTMRRKGNFSPADDPLHRPDIRTLYILFLLSFLSSSTPASLKQSFLAQKDTFTAIFKDIRRDHVHVVRKVLEVSWEGIWEDKRVRKTAKIAVFNEWMLGHVLRLYERDEKDDPSHAFPAADLAHHFLLAVCTRPGTGICFPDDGWYPRETDFSEDNDAAADELEDFPDSGRHQQRGRVYNKILANFLKVLKVGEDSRQQELAIKILEACPELVVGYWPSANITLEPRLSSRWLINASFLGRVVSLPVPSKCFRLSSSGGQSSSSDLLYRPNPPPLATLVSNTFPSLLNRTHLTKGLQAKQALVQLFTAQTLARCFEKLDRLRMEMQKIENELDERPDDGQWRLRRIELEREVRRRVPDFSVIIAFSQQKLEGDGKGLAKRRAMLKEVGLRLLWCYQKSLPELIAESRFDVGKLFTPNRVLSDRNGEHRDGDEASELDALSQLHVLRLLRTSDQFNWSAKASASPHTFLYHFLLLRAQAQHPAISSTAQALVLHLLGNSLLFEHDPSELQIWLESLPTSSPDDSGLGSDRNALTDGVIALLDDCVHRCLKTPYRYVDELGACMTTEDEAGIPLAVRAHMLPSPLLMTLLEQLGVKRKTAALSFSDTLATLVFLRKLILGFSTKDQSLSTSYRLAQKLLDTVASFESDAAPELQGIQHQEQSTFRAEVALLSDSLDILHDAPTRVGTEEVLEEGEHPPGMDDEQQDSILPKETQASTIGELAKLFSHPIAEVLFKPYKDNPATPDPDRYLRWSIQPDGLVDVTNIMLQLSTGSSTVPFNRQNVEFMIRAIESRESQFRPHVSSFIDDTLRWLVRRFSEDETDSEELLDGLRPFGTLLERSEGLKRHLIEPVVTSIIRSRFLVSAALELAGDLCEQMDMPAELVTRYLQSILHHARLGQASSVTLPMLRIALVRLIRVICMAQPQTACQPAHFQRLIHLYGGTLSTSDRIIMSLLNLFEKQRSSTATAVIAVGLRNTMSSRPLDLLLTLDPARLLKTCLDFPNWRDFSDDLDSSQQRDRPDLYDPVYALGLFSVLLSEDTLTGLEWVNVGRTDIIALAVCALGAKHTRMRKVGLTLVVATWKAIQEVEFFERDQLAYNLQLIRNLLASEAGPDRLPTFTVLLVAYAIHSLFHPAVLVYPHISRFLLQRPALDPTDVPLLYGMLYSSSDDWRRERLWIIRFIGNAMKTTADWRAMRRRRTWDLLATVFQSDVDDRLVRQAIFEVLGSLTRNQFATHSLVLRSSLLAWIDVQLLTMKASEALYWLRVIENIVIVVDAEKVEKATFGTWRVDICRCVRTIVSAMPATPDSTALHLLHLSARIMLRVTASQAGPPWTMPELVELCVTALQKIETALGDVPIPERRAADEEPACHRLVTLPLPALSVDEKSQLWAGCVRMLWRVGMACDVGGEWQTLGRWWMQLTSRLLRIGEAGGEEGEWARREVLTMSSDNE